ncbi:MAG: long-chain fatty acid--CoA ligase [Bacteroidia bacterium]|nr:long-chain fatty acid--CoA ligase [Bacteroidia bacterium]
MFEIITEKYKDFKSLHYFLRHTAYVINKPSDTYLQVKKRDRYEDITYAQVFEQLNAISAYMFNLGLRKGDKAALLIENCPEYICYDQALMQLGIVNVSIYPTSSESDLQHIINDSASQIILVGTPFLLKRVKKIKENCPTLKNIITTFEAAGEDVISYQKVIEQGNVLYENTKDLIEQELEKVTYEDLSCLLYTSGTTGKPKGAMLTHNNFMSNIVMADLLLPIVNKDYTFLSFLPLCHVYERTCTYYYSTFKGFKVAFAQSLEALTSNIQEVKPRAILTVPRLLERIEDRVRKSVSTSGGYKEIIFNWAIKAGEKRRINKENDKSNSWFLKLQLTIAEKLVFAQIKERLGGNMSVMVSGGGALPKHVGEFFGNLEMLVIEGYGLTETSPFVCANEIHRQVWGTVGRIGQANEVAIQHVDTKEIITLQTYESYNPTFESGEGEILVRGLNVMKGYWNLPEETAKAIDSEGWLHTGDVGKFEKGYLKITDRIKNIIVNSFGKNVYPTPIENVYMKSNKIEQIFLIGDGQEYLTALIVPSKDEVKEKFSLNEDFFKETDEFIRENEIIEWMEEDMKKLEVNLGKYERVKHFALKRRPFTLEEGEMTPTQKIKRKVVETKYHDEIKSIYVNVS